MLMFLDEFRFEDTVTLLDEFRFEDAVMLLNESRTEDADVPQRGEYVGFE